MDELEEGEESYTLEQAQAHRDLMESERHLTEAKAIALKELRYWLTSHRVEDTTSTGSEQRLTPLVDRDSGGFKTIHNKSMDIIQSL